MPIKKNFNNLPDKDLYGLYPVQDAEGKKVSKRKPIATFPSVRAAEKWAYENYATEFKGKYLSWTVRLTLEEEQNIDIYFLPSKKSARKFGKSIP